jgi:hypothetical protein
MLGSSLLLQPVDDRCEQGLQTTWACGKRRRPSVAAALQSTVALVSGPRLLAFLPLAQACPGDDYRKFSIIIRSDSRWSICDQAMVLPSQVAEKPGRAVRTSLSILPISVILCVR